MCLLRKATSSAVREGFDPKRPIGTTRYLSFKKGLKRQRVLPYLGEETGNHISGGFGGLSIPAITCYV